ncbi:DNA phosphorothioation-associated putative methyltransferase [Hoyosella subflava]|uniref:DNA phosphorothioation-associated putative methyltransferase n=1 Tax=Hoyosella subflava TaxID=639313 RepID=UPI0013050B27|nr:DNA phosphorothioation-associated putative methyltransferase [Hoyosella subflava]
MTVSALSRSAMTAMRRVELSRPIRIGLETGLIRGGDSIFDYGCGHGHDVEFLREMGHTADGWDPNHRPDGALRKASIVNLGFVLNVIEEPLERIEALKRAFDLAHRALIVAVRTVHEAKILSTASEYSDGVLTGTDTFQRFFAQAEAREFLDETLSAQSIPLGPGIFVVFRDESAEQDWLENRAALNRRVRRLRRIVEPRLSIRSKAYRENREILRLLEEFLALRGRLPITNEVPWEIELNELFGTLPKAFQVIRHEADEPWWEDAAADRRQELLVRFALQRLRKLPKFSALPPDVRADVKAHFGSYKRATEAAEELLFSLGKSEEVRSAATEARIGKRTPDALYVHVDAVDTLPAQLKVFVGAAETLIGDVPDATLIKIHIDKPRVSWLVYPKFDTDPHPALAESWVVDFRALDVRPNDYRSRENPPVLHRKELFVSPEHPRYELFKRLSTQEERHGLLEDSRRIGTRRGWQERLDELGWELRGHRLVRAHGG